MLDDIRTLAQLRPLLVAVPSSDAGERSAHYRARRVGDLQKVARGIGIAPQDWQSLSPEERQRVVAVATATSRPDLVFSHRTSAAIWGLPLGSEPDHPEVLRPLHPGGRSDEGTRLHRTTMPFEPVDVDGLRTTDLERTLLDVARTRSLLESVPMLDRAMRAHPDLEVGTLLTQLEDGTSPGRARAIRAVLFANALSESPLESRARVLIDRLGFVAPDLQVEFRDDRGAIGRVDFYWRAGRIIGEADGRTKYLNPRFRAGRTLEQVLLDEKYREDRLRAQASGFIRWGSNDLVRPQQLARKLASAGVPRHQ